MRDADFSISAIEIEPRFNASFECQAPNGTILQLGSWQSIECPIASVLHAPKSGSQHASRAWFRQFRSPQPACSAGFQLSVLALMAKSSGESLDRVCPSAMWNNNDDDDDGEGKSKTEKTFDEQANEQTFVADYRVFRCYKISSERRDFIMIRLTKRQRVDMKSINRY